MAYFSKIKVIETSNTFKEIGRGIARKGKRALAFLMYMVLPKLGISGK